MRLQQFLTREFLTFLVVGVVNTLFGTAIMLVLYNVFGCSYWVSSFCDYFFGSILSYFLNKRYTFHYQGTDLGSILKFALNIVVCYLIAYSLALPLTRMALQSLTLSKPIVENVAMLVGTVLFMLINYLGQKFFAFSRNNKPIKRSMMNSTDPTTAPPLEGRGVPADFLSRLIAVLRRFFRHPFWSDWRTITFVYLLMPVIVALQKWGTYHDTYQIYKSVYVNTLQQLPLYDFYPYLHGDCNHYGPVFFYVIAPFAMLPDGVGASLWLFFLTATFFLAVHYMPLERWQKVFMFWFCAHEVLTPLFVEQYDLTMAASYLLMFACIEHRKPVWAAFFIVVNIFIKLYGVVGLALFFFVEDKRKFILACLGWAALCFVAPMLVSSPEYVLQQYVEWYHSLVAKNAQNLAEAFNTTNTSLLGIPRKISGNLDYSDLWLIIPGILLFLTPFRRIDQYRHVAFRYAMLASLTMFVTLFSTSTESYGYIAPMTGFVVWYTTAPWQRGRWDLVLLVYAFIFTSLCTSDVLFPRFIWKQLIEPYALKALPTTIVWGYLIYEMNTRNYDYRLRR